MKGKILVIDDEESIRFTFENFLSNKGYEVSTAKDFDETLGSIDKTDFDVIFADIVLGDKTGIDILREARKRNLYCPVIMITGYPNIETASDAVRLGAFDYISKPVTQETLLHAANMALQYKDMADRKEKYRLNLAAIFRSVKDGIITVNKELEIIEANESAKNICGISHDYIGKVFSPLDTGCNGKCIQAIKETIKSKKPAELYRLECMQNKPYKKVVSVFTTPLINHIGIFSGVVMVVRDETNLNFLEESLKERKQFYSIIGKSENMQKLYSLVETLADVQTTVLITGESGTGKELFAEAIHYKGQHSDKPLVKLNISSLSENLLESELFGHVKGAFTGADRDKIGRFQMANGGTIFLDEISDISPKTQLQLLRVLQEKEFEKVGDSTTIKVDVRVIAATNQDLKRKVKLGKFREDLYYRLKVMELHIPPLRERREDIPLLINSFLKNLNKQFNKNIEGVSGDVLQIFLHYQWPGNIRELKHALEHAFILCHHSIITVDHLPPEFKDANSLLPSTPVVSVSYDYKTILDAMGKTGGNKTKAAKLLGITVRTLYRKIEKYKTLKDKTE